MEDLAQVPPSELTSLGDNAWKEQCVRALDATTGSDPSWETSPRLCWEGSAPHSAAPILRLRPAPASAVLPVLLVELSELGGRADPLRAPGPP